MNRVTFAMASMLVLCALLLISIDARAQVTTATLVGLVRDTSGAVVPGANVTATHQGTGVPREAVTDERGEFVVSAMPPGPYSVHIALTGFKTYTNEGIQLGSGQIDSAVAVATTGPASGFWPGRKSISQSSSAMRRLRCA